MSDSTTPTPTPLEALWAEAARWALFLPEMFDEPAVIAGAGLSRRVALRCRSWLASIEGIVRRLIIAAALALDPRKLPALRPRGDTATRAHGASSRPPRFRLFAFAGNAAGAGKRPTTSAPQPYAHVPFPADDLLRLGATRRAGATDRSEAASPLPIEAATAPRARNPLHRRGRISRWDPDYRGHQNQDLLTPPWRARRARSQQSGKRPRPARISSLHRLPSSMEWRRVEEEWERIIPAPDLAARIAALLRVIERPALWVRRLARRLQKSNLGAGLSILPAPRLRRPKLDAPGPMPLEDELAAAHAFLRLDTS